ILVGNPDPSRAASVRVDTDGGTVAAATVAPLSTYEFNLGFDRHISATCISRVAYHVQSDRPIHAYQYANFAVIDASTSGALLLDRTSFGTAYIALATPSLHLVDY